MDSQHDVQFASPHPESEGRMPQQQELWLREPLNDGSVAATQDSADADADPAPLRGCLFALPISLALWGVLAWAAFRG